MKIVKSAKALPEYFFLSGNIPRGSAKDFNIDASSCFARNLPLNQFHFPCLGQFCIAVLDLVRVCSRREGQTDCL